MLFFYIIIQAYTLGARIELKVITALPTTICS